jgi:hypothetical protein
VNSSRRDSFCNWQLAETGAGGTFLIVFASSSSTIILRIARFTVLVCTTISGSGSVEQEGTSPRLDFHHAQPQAP